MAAFDITEASGKGYMLLWEERRYLLRLAAVPLLIKLCCFTVLSGLGWEQDFFRQALVLLPSYFADGWMVSHLVRLLLYGQRWPFKPTGNPEKDVARLHERAQGIMGGMLVFVVIEFLLTGLVGVMISVLEPLVTEQPDNTIVLTGLTMIAIAAAIWGFRFLWLFIPAAANYSLLAFTKAIRGFSVSFYMIGTWLICLVPVFLLFRFVISLVIAPFGDGLDNLPFMADFTVTILIVTMDTVIALLTTAALTYGIKDMLTARAEESRK